MDPKVGEYWEIIFTYSEKQYFRITAVRPGGKDRVEFKSVKNPKVQGACIMPVFAHKLSARKLNRLEVAVLFGEYVDED